MINFIKTLFSEFLLLFHGFISKALPLARKIVIGKLKDFAVESIESIKDLDLSNEDKRKKAFDMIKEYAKQNSIEARDSIINLVIELAVLTIKEG